ncbi:MAG: alpha/beta fold hydrolase [Nitrospirota bacterium]|nr:alpha/beta fold hydrolase [Nitrospirota bacterium]
MGNNDTAVVLVHGLGGFARMGIPPLAVDYFNGLPPRFEGLPVYFPALPRNGPIARCGEELARFLQTIPQHTIGLIGHSMGGLDARYVAAHLDPERRIRQVVTIATPHRGSPVARLMNTGSSLHARFFRRALNPAMRELIPENMAAFNAATPNRPDVTYRSWACVRPEGEVFPLFRGWSRLIAHEEGENDTQVSRASASWGRFEGTLRADHLEVVGWNTYWTSGATGRPFDHAGFFTGLVRELLG